MTSQPITASCRVLLGWAIAAVLLAAAPSPAADPMTPEPITKLTRGIMNVALGLPGEVAYHVVNTAHSEAGLQNGGTYTAGVLTGLIVGLGWGFARIGSGFVDVVTFPVPFDDNRPLLEPDYII